LAEPSLMSAADPLRKFTHAVERQYLDRLHAVSRADRHVTRSVSEMPHFALFGTV
jgi:hypothetical protein